MTPGWRIGLLAFLVCATMLSYLDRQALSVAAPLVSRELRLDNAQLGLLLSAFFYTYAVMHLFVGWLLDRTDIRITYAVFLALWSVAQSATGLARGFWDLFTGRLFLGAFETAGQTGAARIIAERFPVKDRALANGVVMSGGSIGAVIAPVLVIALAARYTWRGSLLILGGLGVLWTVAWLLWSRSGLRTTAASSTQSPTAPPEPLSRLVRNRYFLACLGGAVFTIPVIHISSAWLPTYFVQRWNLSLSGTLSTYLFLLYLGLDAGFLLGGAVIRRLAPKHGPMPARRTVMIASTILMLSAAVVPLAPSPAVAAGLLFLMNAGRASWGAIFLAYNQDVAPGRVSTVAGAMGCAGALAGAFLVWTIGVISKSSGFDIPFLMIAALAVLGTLPVISAKWENLCTT